MAQISKAIENDFDRSVLKKDQKVNLSHSMTLNEKLLEAIEENTVHPHRPLMRSDQEKLAKECEAIAVEFAIGFADYVEHLVYTHNPLASKSPDELIKSYKQSLNK